MNEPPQVSVSTRFSRSNFCRVIRVDGVWGTVTPQLSIHMALFTERWALPTGTTIRPDADGTLKDFPEDVPGVLEREIEADVILTEQAAVFLRDWLDMKISELRVQLGEMPARQEPQV